MSGTDFVFNVAKGRVRTYYDNIDTNSPANSAFIIVPLEATGLEADATLKDYDDLASLLAGTSNEQTTLGRKTLTDTDLAASAQDDTNDRLDLDIPDITWTSTAGNAIGKVLVCYDADTTAGTDANIIPVTAHSCDMTPDGTDFTAVINTAGFYRAQDGP